MAGGGETIRRRTVNKIYKLIWNKVRNCYVAVSEFAKGHGKGSGVVGGAVVGTAGVNGGAKAKGRCAALTLAFALCVTGGAVFTMPQVASADGGTITVTNKAKEGKFKGDNRQPENRKNTNPNGTNASAGRQQSAVRTGDQTPVLPLMITMIIAAAAVVFLVLFRKRLKRKN